MKRFTTLMLALLAFTVFSFAQDDDGYVMFENTRISVKTDMYKEFGEAMANHNKTFHSKGAYHANLWMVSVGERSGQFVWSMGPLTFADVDNRPGGKEHLEDWLYKVMPTLKYVAETNYWKLDDKHSYNPNPEALSTKLSISVFDLEDFQEYRFKELLNKVIKVYKEKEYDRSFSTYWPKFDVKSDEDVAIVGQFEKWADFDDDRNFKKDFEEVHGPGSWESFIEEFKGSISGVKDEVWELIPDLSGDMEE